MVILANFQEKILNMQGQMSIHCIVFIPFCSLDCKSHSHSKIYLDNSVQKGKEQRGVP